MGMEGLKGLKGLKGLSDQEYNDWRNQQLEAGKIKETTSFANQEKLYNNQLYVAKYGADSFKLYSYDERNARYKEDVLRESVINKYAGDPKLDEYLTLSNEGLEDLMFGFEDNGKLRTHENLWTAEERQDRRRYDESTGMSQRQKELANQHMFVAPGMIRTPQQRTYEGEVNARKSREEINEEIYQTIKSRDNQRLQDKAKPRAIEIQKEILDLYNNNELSYEDIDNEFNNAVKDSNYYKAFSNAKELENYTLEQKISDISYYRAISEMTDINKASEVTDQRMRNHISDAQSGWDWAGGTLTNIGVGGLAHIANTGLGYYALIAGLGSDEDLNLFLQGKRKDGSELPSWLNPQYWNGVDQFNTLSAAEINRARENGGISQFNNITRSGEDLDFWNWNTLNEGAKMAKYIWSTALMSYIGGITNNAIASKFGATFTKSIFNPLTTLNPTVAGAPKVLHTIGNVGINLNASAPMAFSMGVNTYGEAKTAMFESIQKQINKDYNKLIDDEVQGLSQQDLNSLVEEHLQHSDIVKTINDRVTELEKLGTYNEQNIKPSREELTKVVTEQIRTNLLSNPKQLVEYYRGESISNLLNSQYAKDFHNAELAATNAFKTQATITAIKESITNQALRGYLFSKGNRLKLFDDIVENIGVDADGMFTNLFKLRPLMGIGTQVGGEFGDEWFDFHSENFSQGFGLGWFNNVTRGIYNPESYVRSQGFIGNFVSGIDQGIKNVEEHFWDKDGIYEGLIGAISPFMATPNIIGTAAAIFEHTNKQDGNTETPGVEQHWSQVISKYITNPLISSIAEQYEKSQEIDAEIALRNAVLAASKKDLLEISEIIADFDTEENAVLTHDVRKAKDAKLRRGFNTAWMLNSMSDDKIYSKSSLISETKSKLESYAEGKIDDDIITAFLGQANNKSLNNQNDARKVAATKIQENAKELLEMQKTIKEAEQALSETLAGQQLNPITKKQLIFSKAFDDNYNARINALEKEITGSSEVSTRNDVRAIFSTEEGKDAVLQAMTDELTELQDKKQKIKEGLKDNPKDPALKLALQSIEEEYAELNSEYQKLFVTEIQATPLTKEEILSLNPEQRLKMLHPDNLKLYSAEQQAIIKETLRDLRLKDPNIMQKLVDSAVLSERKRANNKAYNKVLENTTIHAQYVKEESAKLFDRSINVLKKIAINEIKNIIMFDDNPKETILAKGYSSEIVETAVEEWLSYRKDDIGYEEHKDYYDTIISLIKLQESANTIINTKFGGDKALKSFIAQITLQEPTVAWVMTKLEQAVDLQTNPTYKERLETLLIELEQIGHQRAADVINSREEKKKREAELQAKRDADEKAKKDALGGEQSKFEVDESALEDVPITLNGDGEPISPDLKEQSQGDNVSKPQQVIPDITAEGNILHEDTGIFNGLIFPEFNNQSLINDGYLLPERDVEHTGDKTEFYKFLDDRAIDLQGIIDFELASILKENPDVEVHFMMVKQNENAANIPFLVIEYTEDVKKHHKTERNGVIPSGGKEWLIIGQAYAATQEYIDFLNIIKRKRFGYFNYNPDETYYVSDAHTKINQIGSGRRVRRLQGEEETKQRKISELLYDENGEYNEERNPHHLGDSSDKSDGYTSLSWAIQKSEQFITVNAGDTEVIHLSTPSDNIGSVFLLVPTTNGKLLPLYINPSFYSEIINSKLGDKIKEALTELTNPDLAIRKKKKDQLRQYLVLTEEDDILIGNDEHPTISIKKNGTIIRTHAIDGTFSLQAFLSDVEALNPRINITVSVLQDATMMELYDEAGALTLDVAMLGTRNGSFTTYAVNSDGKPVIPEVPTATTPTRSSNNSRQRRVAYNGQQYSLVEGKWFDANDNMVTDNDLIKKIEYQQAIFNRTPNYTAKNGDNYYILDNNSENPVVIKQAGKEIIITNKEQALAMINLVNKIKEAEELAKAAEAEFVVLGIEVGTTPTADPIAQMLEGLEGSQQPTNATATEEVKKTKETTKSNEGKALKDLVSTEDLTTFAKLISKTAVRTKLKKIFKEKEWTYTNSTVDMINFLISKKVPVTNITDVDTWLKIIKDCR